jgi:hypothetical protein
VHGGVGLTQAPGCNVAAQLADRFKVDIVYKKP